MSGDPKEHAWYAEKRLVGINYVLFFAANELRIRRALARVHHLETREADL